MLLSSTVDVYAHQELYERKKDSWEEHATLIVEGKAISMGLSSYPRSPQLAQREAHPWRWNDGKDSTGTTMKAAAMVTETAVMGRSKLAQR